MRSALRCPRDLRRKFDRLPLRNVRSNQYVILNSARPLTAIPPKSRDRNGCSHEAHEDTAATEGGRPSPLETCCASQTQSQRLDQLLGIGRQRPPRAYLLKPAAPCRRTSLGTAGRAAAPAGTPAVAMITA